MTINQILNEINESNSSNYKLDVLKKYSDNLLFKRVLKMAFDKVQYNYGIGRLTLSRMEDLFREETLSLEEALDFLEFKLSNRELTGNAAISELNKVLCNLSPESREIIEGIIKRDLRINCGKTQINKVHKDLITKPIYQRCDTYNKKTAFKINFKNGAFIQKKADGTFRAFNNADSIVTSTSRSGEDYVYPLHFEQLSAYRNGNYIGELTVIMHDGLLAYFQEKLRKTKEEDEKEAIEKVLSTYSEYKEQNKEYILPRGFGNGILNSLDVPHEYVLLELWDYVTDEEYSNAARKIKNTKTYEERFNELKSIVTETKNIRIIETYTVYSIQEALKLTSDFMNMDYEGSILKDKDAVFKDGSNAQQLKLKLCISVEMRIIGFHEGTKGTKREGKVGSIIFGNDEGTIKGKCSGFSDDFLDEISANREKFLDKIIEVEFNDLSKASGNNYWALSHPRFIEIRNDKTETDTLERAFQLKEMAMQLGSVK